MKHQNERKVSGWFVLLNLVAFGIYAFILSVIGGTIVWVCLEMGLSYEVGIIVALAFFVIEFVLFVSAMRSPAVKATNALLRPIIVLAGRIVRAWPCALSSDIERDITRQFIRSTSKLLDAL
ncbi:MAG TPA: hypothetical protein PLY52_02160 [Methanothrix sp.]|jgi:hypothetical protein|nr:hypothetical protein [Euryarchaeota archaeon]HON35098.1 hypothetical protein [Methanothrix sp.]